MREHSANVFAADMNGLTPLHYAARKNSEVAINALLVGVETARRRQAVNFKDQRGHTPLFFAASHGCEAALTALLRNSADANAVDKSGATAAHHAAALGHASILRLLHEAGGRIDFGGMIHDLSRPLHYAAVNGHADVVATLLNLGCDPLAVNADKRSPLLLAARGGSVEVIRRTAEVPSVLRSINLGDSNGATPLLAAAMYGHHDAVGVLLSLGADPNAKDTNGNTALFAAVRQQHLGAVRVLVGADGCDLELLAGGALELVNIQPLRGIEVSEDAVEYASRPESTRLGDMLNSFTDFSLLHAAAAMGSVRIFSILVDAMEGRRTPGTRRDWVRRTAGCGSTVLHFAIMARQVLMMKALLDQFGSEVDDACLESAVRAGDDAVFEELVTRGLSLSDCTPRRRAFGHRREGRKSVLY